MQTLYPAIKPYSFHQVAVDELHALYVEESGNPKGLPVVVLHGGPGSGSNPEQRRFFDPAFYRIILFDQRGSGHSTPHGELKKNTTLDLVSDLEALRQHLNIDRWILFGGSWGSTLALVYAETHPERVITLVLRGIFLGRQQDIDWFYKAQGVSRLFPEAFDEFVNHLPKEERNNILKNYHHHLTGDDELARMAAAKAWAQWEGTCSTLLPNPEMVHHFTDPHTALSLARIETHYFVNHLFLESNYILKNVERLANIPGVIVHGRYDMVCPFDNAYALHQAWPKSELLIVRDAGHSQFEPGIIVALTTTMNNIARHNPK